MVTNAQASDDRDGPDADADRDRDRDRDDQSCRDRNQYSENEPQLPRRSPGPEPQTSYGNNYLPGRMLRFSPEEDEEDTITGLPSNPLQRGSTRRRREDTPESENGEEDLEPIMCFIPGEDLDLMVLEHYIKKYVDKRANVRPSHHPTVSVMD